MDKKTLMKTIRDKKLTESELDEVVHDAASLLATDANNGGLEKQVDFLLGPCGWSPEEVIAQLP